jgi:uncharacterized phiE125 gp8 family phage protein
MNLTLKTAAELEPVTLSEVKAHLNIGHGDDDTLLGEYLTSAIAELDGRDGTLGRALVNQVWTLKLPGFPSEIRLPMPPTQSVDAITYIDREGVTQSVAPSAYAVSGLGGMHWAVIRPASGHAWPATGEADEAVTIDFTAGFGATSDKVPAPIRHAIKERVSQLYENRVEGSQMPASLDAYRDWTF